MLIERTVCFGLLDVKQINCVQILMHNDLVLFDVDKQNGIWFFAIYFRSRTTNPICTLVTCSRNLRFNNLNKLVVSIQFRRAMKRCFCNSTKLCDDLCKFTIDFLVYASVSVVKHKND
jgi:hypothetical protein